MQEVGNGHDNTSVDMVTCSSFIQQQHQPEMRSSLGSSYIRDDDDESSFGEDKIK